MSTSVDGGRLVRVVMATEAKTNAIVATASSAALQVRRILLHSWRTKTSRPVTQRLTYGALRDRPFSHCCYRFESDVVA